MRFTGTARAVAVSAVAVAAAVVLPGAAVATHPDVVKPFRAGHADRCLSSQTAGDLHWRATHPPALPAVDVIGSITLRNPGNCQFLVPPTAVATFTAYIGRQPVDTRRVATTDADRFRFTLTPANATIRPVQIDYVVIQVCHGSSVVNPPSPVEPAPSPNPANCGAPVTISPRTFVPQS